MNITVSKGNLFKMNIFDRNKKMIAMIAMNMYICEILAFEGLKAYVNVNTGYTKFALEIIIHGPRNV